jgi:hypothetical protein
LYLSVPRTIILSFGVLSRGFLGRLVMWYVPDL